MSACINGSYSVSFTITVLSTHSSDICNSFQAKATTSEKYIHNEKATNLAQKHFIGLREKY